MNSSGRCRGAVKADWQRCPHSSVPDTRTRLRGPATGSAARVEGVEPRAGRHSSGARDADGRRGYRPRPAGWGPRPRRRPRPCRPGAAAPAPVESAASLGLLSWAPVVRAGPAGAERGAPGRLERRAGSDAGATPWPGHGGGKRTKVRRMPTARPMRVEVR